MSPNVLIPNAGGPLTATEICAGILRLLSDLGYAPLTEFDLGNGRRIDIAAINRRGRIAFVEVKSSAQDYRSDGKWPEYLDYCDYFYFGVAPEFPLSLFDAADARPGRTGIIVADRYGGDILRPAAEGAVNAARRKSETLRFARRAADRLSRQLMER